MDFIKIPAVGREQLSADRPPSSDHVPIAGPRLPMHDSRSSRFPNHRACTPMINASVIPSPSKSTTVSRQVSTAKSVESATRKRFSVLQATGLAAKTLSTHRLPRPRGRQAHPRPGRHSSPLKDPSRNGALSPWTPRASERSPELEFRSAPGSVALRAASHPAARRATASHPVRVPTTRASISAFFPPRVSRPSTTTAPARLCPRSRQRKPAAVPPARAEMSPADSSRRTGRLPPDHRSRHDRDREQ